ncbi:GTP 3',8-cyclase MoaA [Streptomyces sp. NRRL F-2664]|uniref:GTP 3',8-cyclase MoaA n=1 Tax=Streptomyces sp. NRRL F-2664 TaxID=1463842 RepID=UPI0004C86E45|nr:GTP 3',8-cyclase MoaA [Streptomyces sp. NRRL F-2664]
MKNGAVGTGPRDLFGRPLGDLRLSVTDQCNLRCQYCMPEEHYTWLPRSDLLTVGEIGRLVDVFISLGVAKVRLTGGEPLIRPELSQIVSELAGRFGAGLRDLAVTTNGVLLAKHVAALKEAGLSRVTVSLDTLRPDRFEALSRRKSHGSVMAGIRSLAEAGFTGTKIDTVVMRGVNEDELADLIEFGRGVRAEVRFIEYMDVGGATGWQPSKVVSRAEILESLERHYGAAPVVVEAGGPAPADRYGLPGGRVFGVVSSTTQPFCSTCNRTRLTADGILLTCLYSLSGLNLRAPLREGASQAELRELVESVWLRRADRGAENRLAQRERGVFVPLDRLRDDPHLEMHTRGG